MEARSREARILGTIVEAYIADGEPVSSHAVADRSALKLSSASMRNSMAELTDLGYLAQPHTSAGRVPTALAFQYYVDVLLQPRPLGEADKAAILEALDRRDEELGAILRRACSMLSARSGRLGLAVSPGRDEARWLSINFSSLDKKLVLAVLSLEGGLTSSLAVPISEIFDQDELIRCANYLNSHFKGLPLSKVRRGIADTLQREGGELKNLCHDARAALSLVRLAVEKMDDGRELFVDGARQVVMHSEFADLERLKEMLFLLEERSRLLDLLGQTLDQGREVSVLLCRPEGGLALPWAVISAPYSNRDGQPLGVVSVMGAPRMDYAAVVPVVGHISRVLSDLLHAR